MEKMQEKAVFRSWLFSVKYYIQMNIFGLNKILNHLGFFKMDNGPQLAPGP